MYSNERWNLILDLLKEKGQVTVEELVESVGVSVATIRRDLLKMEEEKLLTRTRGGAKEYRDIYDFKMKHRQSIFEENDLGLEYATNYLISEKLQENKSQKIKIAQKAASLVKDGESIFIDASSSTYYIIDYIKASEVIILTDGLSHLQKIAERGFETYILGGALNHDRGNISLNDDSLMRMKKINFDKAFIGMKGVDAISGYTTSSMLDYNMKRMIMGQSKEVYVLGTSDKIGTTHFVSFGKIDEAILITDASPSMLPKGIRYITT